jgi:leucyl-tRNA synthetase
MYGRKAKNGMIAEYFTEEVFDYIFLGNGNFTSEPKIKLEILDEMRESFNYWYPMDLRCSARDLIRNHLTMSLYNH